MNQKLISSKHWRNKINSPNNNHQDLEEFMENFFTDDPLTQGVEPSNPVRIPSLESVIEIIHQTRKVLFPGYFLKVRFGANNLEYSIGHQVLKLRENLSKQIILSIQHDCFSYDHPCSRCVEQGNEHALSFIMSLPEIKNILATDVDAALEGDPAAKNRDEVIFCYPGLFAIMTYRIAHILHKMEIPLLPRMMTEYAHSVTGIDIHPGAKIGRSFFIGHGTGIVVGETTEIGERVRLYQGVTLGALSLPRDAGNLFKNRKRHPTIEDDVIIYSNATILGGETVVGTRSIIGGNVWLTESVPPDTKVILKKPELDYIGNN
jgi:serine O-acetyltransferase